MTQDESKITSWPPGSCSPVRPLGVLFCVCGVVGLLAPVHRCARSVCCFACAVSLASWLLFTGVPAGCVVLCLRCPGPSGSCSPVCPLGVLFWVCGVLGFLALVHRCARSVCCVACAVSWASLLLFTGAPARCVVLRVRCPGPPGSCSPVCPLGVLSCVCGVLGHLAPVHRCACAVCCVVCPVSSAAWLLFTGVFALCVVLWVARGVSLRGASLRGAHSSIRTAAVRSRHGLGTLRAHTRPSGRRLFVAGRGWVPSGRALVHPDGGCSYPAGAGYPPGAHSSIRTAAGVRVLALCGRVGRAGLPGALWCASPFPLAASSFCFAWPPPGCGGPPLPRCCCSSSLPCAPLVFFFFFVLCVRRPGPPGSCSPVCTLCVWCGVYGVLGLLAPVHRCARSARGVACTVSWASWLLFTGVHALCVVLRVRRPGPPGSCSPVCTLCVWCCVYGVLGLLAPVHRCARSVCGVACTVSWASWLLFTGAHALCVVLRARCPGPPGSCSPVCTLCVWCCVYGVLGLLAPVHRCARSVCGVACTASWASWLLFTGVHALCVVLRVRCPGPPGSCSPVCTLCAWCCVYGVLGLLAPVHRCARSVCVYGVVGLLAPVHRCARSVRGVACTVSWASWLLFTGVHILCVVLRVRRPGPPGSCSPVCTLCVWCCVYGVLGLLAPVHRCARSVRGVACTVS